MVSIVFLTKTLKKGLALFTNYAIDFYRMLPSKDLTVCSPDAIG